MDKGNRIKRILKLPRRSFFLFGARGVGKSTWLRETLPEAIYFDLLESSLFLRLCREPGELEAMIGNRRENSWVVIDEIQKIPTLLDEVHRLMERRHWRFALCGSSARKLRRGGVNLLAGRAITRYLEGFSSTELQADFDLDLQVQWGALPLVNRNCDDAADILSAYVDTYIKEEIKEEGIVRNLPPFLRFLGIAGQLNGQIINRQNIAREAAVPRSNVDVYFNILEDSLLGHFLLPYRPHAKVRERTHPKFYWFDAGVARAAAGLVYDPIDQIWRGTSLETLIFHELRVYNHTRGRNRQISFYRTASGTEIDFIVEIKKREQYREGAANKRSHLPAVVCVEVKSANKWNRKWEKPMRSLSQSDKLTVAKMFGVYTGTRSYHFDGIDVLPVPEFLDRLHRDEIF